MRRLLQGDVGSGKTIVAFQAMLVAMENGYQAALMAPTGILATQHFSGGAQAARAIDRKPSIVLLTGSLDEERKRTQSRPINRRRSESHHRNPCVIEEKVEFDRLGLVVVDEQHRFGVLQRFKLMKKPNQPEPDVLVMTATPIPRTLALSLYGDLDLSVLDELPPGRMPIDTRRVPGENAEKVWDFVRKQVARAVRPTSSTPSSKARETTSRNWTFLTTNRRLESSRVSENLLQKVRRRSCLFPKVAQEASPSARSGLRSAVEMHEKLRTDRLPACASACSMGGLTPTKRKSSCAAFSAAKLMFSYRQPSLRLAWMCLTPQSWW